LLRVDRAAEAFDGLPSGVSVHGQLLAAFKAGAPRIGLGPRLVHAIDWLFRFTQPQDWGRGGRPIVWPSALMQREALGLSETRVKALNRALIEAGLITMKDSPNGKRYGRRDNKGRIVEAYGFDLSPLAARHAEFVRLAEEARAERAEMGRLRRRATIARNGISQILETAVEYGFQGDEWTTLIRDSRALGQALRRVERPDEMALGVESLERRQRQAREHLETLLATLVPNAFETQNPDPMRSENGPHQYTYNSDPDPDQDTVMASDECKPPLQGPSSQAPGPTTPRDPNGMRGRDGEVNPPVLSDSGTVLRVSVDELLRLAPRLRTYLRTSAPGWREIVDAADWLRGELGVSRPLWGEACLAMGRERAAIAIAIVSARPVAYFRTTPGGYFHGMVAKAKAGELNLARTIWGLRLAKDGKKGGLARGRHPSVPPGFR
jgi:replication initiation protein RepC